MGKEQLPSGQSMAERANSYFRELPNLKIHDARVSFGKQFISEYFGERTLDDVFVEAMGMQGAFQQFKETTAMLPEVHADQYKTVAIRGLKLKKVRKIVSAIFKETTNALSKINLRARAYDTLSVKQVRLASYLKILNQAIVLSQSYVSDGVDTSKSVEHLYESFTQEARNKSQKNSNTTEAPLD